MSTYYKRNCIKIGPLEAEIRARLIVKFGSLSVSLSIRRVDLVDLMHQKSSFWGGFSRWKHQIKASLIKNPLMYIV